MSRIHKKLKVRTQRELRLLEEFLASSERAREAQRKSIKDQFQIIARNKHGFPVVVEARSIKTK